MIPVTFPECNVVLAMAQDEYEPLQAYRAPDGQTICAFRLSPKELEAIAKTKTIWISTLTFNKPFQPIGLSTECPFERAADNGEVGR
jgi:hypothetical protein